MQSRWIAFLACTSLGGGSALAQSVSVDSPFLPPGGNVAVSAEAPANPSDYEWVGVMGQDDQARYAILKKSTGKSFWLTVGNTEEGLTLDRRDDSDMITVRQAGSAWTLRLRPATAGRSVVQTYTPPPLPVAPVYTPRPAVPLGNLPPQPPVTHVDPVVAEKEREARMLVSDLLEIGMQQRKAYEEAQKRKAAEIKPAERK